MTEVFLDTILDTVKTIPFLLAIYLLLEFFQTRSNKLSLSARQMDRFGPLLGGTAGCIPQCGFSAAAAEMYNKQLIRGGTLLSVFLATSDEAIPVLLSGSGDILAVGKLIFSKLFIAVVFGYLLNALFFRKESLLSGHSDVMVHCCESDHHQKNGNIIGSALFHTIKTTAFILVTMAVINLSVYYLGDERFSTILLSGNVFQPFVTALIGLIPGCSVSVLITQLFVDDLIPFGSAVAGLSTGAGFGYVMLLKNGSVSKILRIIVSAYLIGAVSGVLINLITAG